MKIFKHRDDDYVNTAIETMMQSLEDDSQEPSLGIFWYDVYNDELFGVNSSLASECPSYTSSTFNCTVKTTKKLHEQVWKKEFHRKKDRRFLIKDYTKVPRGRVFWFEGVGYVVFTGEWIDKYPQVKELIRIEFDLPKDTEFRKDEHWNIGHGWSDELI